MPDPRTILRRLASLGVLVALACAPAGAAAARAHESIVGGQAAEPGTFPWLAAVFHEGPGEGFQCTGTVVSPNVVLTAAHCAEDVRTGARYATSGYLVVTGNVDFAATPRQILAVSTTVIYPGFRRRIASGDAALLILATPTTAPAITLASGPLDSASAAAGRAAVMTGWGETFAGGPAPEGLRWAHTVVQPARYCRARVRGFVAREELCTLDAPTFQTDACFGDSGGPLLGAPPGGGEAVELGVASHLYTQCLPSSPAIYTRADLIGGWVHDWISAAGFVQGTTTPTTVARQSSQA